MDGGTFPERPSEDDLLTGFWAQELQIRAETVEWVYVFPGARLRAAIRRLDACIALSQTGQRRVLNDAIFTAFNDMYVGISRVLECRAARFMTVERV